jgi:hypothetical protein
VTTISPEAGAARAEGARAARDGAPASACPYPTAGWVALNWLVGHSLELGRDEAADLFREAAKNAKQRESRLLAALARELTRVPESDPSRPSKPCARADAGCENPVVWPRGRSRADFEAKRFCSHACRMAGLKESAATTPRKPPVRRAPAVVTPPAPVVAPQPVPVVVTPLTPAVWHAARDGMTEQAMRRLFNLNEQQAARVMELQRRGSRAAA